MTKTKLIFAAAALTFLASCASDDTTNKQTEQEPGTEGLTSFVEDDNSTRTTAEYDGSGLNFYWTTGDRLWVNNGGTLIQDTHNSINSLLIPSSITGGVQRAARASFSFAGTYTASSYPVRYTGKGNANGDKITIKASQTQTIPNDASHIGEDGDCGVANAQKQSDGKYHFALDHKAAYITFMPYTTQTWGPNAVIQKIRVFTGNTSDALAGTFDLADNGTLSNPASTSNSVELTVPDFSIPNTETYTTNGATMVVNPGTYNNVSIEYTLHDPVTNVTGNITKTYPSVTFTAGKNKKVKTDLQVTVYPRDAYYMWDAQQQFWYGHESAQPAINETSDPTNSWPHSKATDPDRWYNEVMGYSDPSGTAPAVLPTTSRFQACPNLNEICWYVKEGNPHWDNTTLWATMGHLCANGLWFRKQSVIAAAQSPIKTVADLKAAAPDGIDYTRSTINNPGPSYYLTSIPSGKPSNLNDYFYLPALGYYYWWKTFGSVGHEVLYWSSTPIPQTMASYYLTSDNGSLFAGGGTRGYGAPVWTAQ